MSIKYINPNYLNEDRILALRKEFEQAKPYRHVVMDSFLVESSMNLLHDNFPSSEKLSRHYKGLNENKSEGANFNLFHTSFAELKNQLCSPKFYDFISKITGIPEVFITDDQLGAGLHQGGQGSFLDIHIDFNIHHVKNVHRRLNLLIYFNQDWKTEYGGQLEMWNANMTQCEKYIEPILNRCVIFETNEISYHGYTRKLNLPTGETRKSFYAYFYTDIRDGAISYHDTVFKSTPDENVGKKIKTTIKETLKNNIKSTFKKLGIKF